MKKYNNSFPCYGQTVTGRINYYQKMGVVNGIIGILKDEMRRRGLNIKNWTDELTVNGVTVGQTSVTMIIPTREDDWINDRCPVFEYDNEICVVDMIYFSDELSVHLMAWHGMTKTYKNRFWHTVREGLTLEQTCTLFEYISDVVKDLIVLPSSAADKYNATGALIK